MLTDIHTQVILEIALRIHVSLLNCRDRPDRSSDMHVQNHKVSAAHTAS